jgi:hypothetical protein
MVNSDAFVHVQRLNRAIKNPKLGNNTMSNITTLENDFARIEGGQYFVTSADGVDNAVADFRKSVVDTLDVLRPGQMREYGYVYSMVQVKTIGAATYPRIIGLQPDPAFETIQIVYSFGLLDTIDLTTNFSLRGYS